ncbi:hypothetical protein QLX67_09305, partial [Balneolaceae bacterium ANBcel3]|nr:hypothetical protein [Balneolaceae bacterium ANBcel3]
MSKTKKKNRGWYYIGFTILGFVLLVVFLKMTGVIGGEPMGRIVETSSVSERDITRIVTATGRIQPEVEVKIAPDVSGEIV